MPDVGIAVVGVHTTHHWFFFQEKRHYNLVTLYTVNPGDPCPLPKFPPTWTTCTMHSTHATIILLINVKTKLLKIKISTKYNYTDIYSTKFHQDKWQYKKVPNFANYRDWKKKKKIAINQRGKGSCAIIVGYL